MTHIPTMSSSALPQESENKREHSGTKSQGLVTVRSQVGVSGNTTGTNSIRSQFGWDLVWSFQVLTQSFFFVTRRHMNQIGHELILLLTELGVRFTKPVLILLLLSKTDKFNFLKKKKKEYKMGPLGDYLHISCIAWGVSAQIRKKKNGVPPCIQL